MNKIFKVIWNPATGTFAVARETAKSRGKKSGRSKLLISALVAGGLLSSFGVSASGLDGGKSAEEVAGGTPLTDEWLAIGKGAVAEAGGPQSGTAAVAVGALSNAVLGGTALGYKSNASGDRALSLGQVSTASGSRAIAIGGTANASADFSLALGNMASASGEYATAIGKDSSAIGLYSLAIGYEAKTTADNSLAMGNNTVASGVDSLAFGRNTTSYGTGSIALGTDSKAAKDYGVALGYSSDAYGIGTLAFGQNAAAGKSGGDILNAIAIGTDSLANNANTLALGAKSNATGNNSISLGYNAITNGNNAVAIGANSVAGTDNTVSVGSNTLKRKIVNVGSGAISDTSTDAINGSQLYSIGYSVAERFGGSLYGSTINSDGTLNAPTYYLKSGIYNNVGEALSGIDNDTLHWDDSKKAFSASYIVKDAAGDVIETKAENKIINVAAGEISDTSTDAVNGSQLNTVKNDVADLAEDALQWDANAGAFSASHGTTATNKITNLAAGTVSGTSTDAINGSQLYGASSSVVNALGGGSVVNADGSISAPTYSVAGGDYNNVGDALTAIDDDMNVMGDTVTDLAQDALQWDDNLKAYSAKHGTVTTNKITNVAAGELSATSTDAVNGSQLNTVKTDVATNTTNITNLSTEIDGLSDDALQWNGTAFSASHGSVTTNKITNVAAGDINAKSTDAINGSQLYDLSGEIASYFGGGAAVSDTGEFTGPTYTIGSQDYTSVGDALNAINASFNTSLGDALLWDSNASAFSASHGTSTASKIINVANGDVNATSTDAVNGGQLYGVSNSVADALGGDATVNADGTISAPNYTIAGNSYNNVGDALEAIDDDALLWDEDKGAFNAAHGTETASKITNVADGNISATSKDVVNGSQLNTTNMMINQNTALINQLAGDTSTTYVEENGAGVNYIRTNDTGLTFNDASASGEGATAVGYNASASGNSSIAIGRDSSSLVDGGIALGSGSVSNRVIATGSSDISVTENGVVIGYDTTDGELLGALSVGKDGESYRQIINVADGTEAHDVVTVRQLQNAIGAVATTPTKYYHANSTAEDSLAVGEDSLAMGAKTVVNGNAGIGIGLNTLVLADAINGIAIGSNASANHANSIAMGNGSQTTRGAQTGYTAYNMDAPQNSVGEFSVGSEDGQRQITNVAAGSADTDAVNVGQLKVTDERVAQNTQNISNLNNQIGSLDTRVTNIENNMGDIITTGSTKYFKTNSTGPDANAQGADSVAMGAGSIAAADNSVALGTGSVANEENTISVGSSTNQRRITNVAAGKNATDAVNVAQLKASEAGSVRYSTNEDGSVDYSNISLGDGKGGTTRISNVSAAVNDNDAVNYAQLKQSVQETTQYTDQRMAEMDHKLSKTESKLSGGIASAMAMTGLPQAYTPGASMASIGGGTYNGESAVALGVSMVSANGRWVYKLQGSTNSQGEYSAAVGAGIQW
ncbi:YadA-like family protein [Salmonella enterica subsp. enterica serovar Hillegersberg]|uniref:YadA-like family protein n=1 Tax=Salmonella enterica TaxID=28901 RepID=UPI001D07D056|nr:YadA-like family protein [Salmonella enterica]MCB7133416.1 YadA-like family protein [Salmonella enterica subsp. enterica serovar Hillegersberg]